MLFRSEQQEQEQQLPHNPAWEGQPQQPQGGAWDAWPNQPPQGQRYVPYEEFLQLSQSVGEVDNTLHGVHEDVNTLSFNFNNFMSNFPNYYQ